MDLSKSGNITEHYKNIGSILLEVEPLAGFYSNIIKKVPSILTSSLAFTPVEVITEYRDDLLDYSLNDDYLYIAKSSLLRGYNIFALLGLIAAVFFAYILIKSGVEQYLAATAMILIIIPSAIAWHLAPKLTPNRRLFFAKLLDAELKRRNGNIDGNKIMRKISEFVPSPEPQTANLTKNIN